MKLTVGLVAGILVLVCAVGYFLFRLVHPIPLAGAANVVLHPIPLAGAANVVLRTNTSEMLSIKLCNLVLLQLCLFIQCFGAIFTLIIVIYSLILIVISQEA